MGGETKCSKEIRIGRNSFGNEFTIISARPLGEIVKIKEEVKIRGDNPSDHLTTTIKEIRFGDGEKEVACRFNVEDTASVVAELAVDILYLSPDAQISEDEVQSKESIKHKLGYWGDHDLTKGEEE